MSMRFLIKMQAENNERGLLYMSDSFFSGLKIISFLYTVLTSLIYKL